MSWKAGVKTGDDTEFAFNALRFETREEAQDYVRDLMWRWLAVREAKVEESDEPVNYRFIERKLISSKGDN